MADFTMELAEIHGEINKTNAIMSDKDGIIEITSLREFKLPNEYNSVIAYVGDVNSQIITFQLPESHEGHKLSECNYKKLKWKNLGNNIEGISELEIDAEDGKIASWVVPPEVFTSAGAIEISISIYDIKNGKIAFSWNTPTYKGLSVGEAFSKVGETTNEELFPSKDEILFIDDETRAIVAPKGYNNVVCNFGDKNTSKIYFQVKRYINGIDVLGENTSIGAIIHFNAIDKSFAYPTDGDQLIIRKKNYAEGSVGDGLITLIWNLPPWLTNNNDSYMGSFSIALSFTSPISNKEQNQIEQEEFEEEPQEAEDIELKWTTSPYKNLIIGNVLPDEIAQASERPDIRADWDAQSGPNSISNKPLIKTGKNDYATEIGVRTYAGCNAFRITAIDPYGYSNVTKPTEMLLTLDSVESLEERDVCSIIVNSNYMNFGTITAINGQTITVDNYPETLTAAILDRTTLKDPENTEKTKPYLFIADKQVVQEYPVGTVSIDGGQVAEGIDSKALLRASHAEGDSTTAAGRYSHAEGNNTFAGYAAHAEGQNSKAIGNVSHAEGGQTTASGLYSHTEGQYSTASGNHSHAEGYDTNASGGRAHSEGNNTTASGDSSHSEGNMTYARGVASHAEGGGRTTASGDYSHAEGFNSKALKDYSHAEGYQTTAEGICAHSEGNKTSAKGADSHSEGAGSKATGDQSHAEGQGTVASAWVAHAEGYNTTASKNKSHAEGGETKATGESSHAEGQGTESSGAQSHAEGLNSKATAPRTHAEGWGTIAAADSQHVQGKYNEEDTGKAHIIGGGRRYQDGTGTWIEERKNIHTVDWNGNAWFAGDIKIGGTDYNSGQKLLTQFDKDALEAAIARASGENTITRKVTGCDHHIRPTNPYGKGYFSKLSGTTYQMPEVVNRDNLGIKKYEYIYGENQIRAEGNTITLNGSLSPGEITLELEEPLISDVEDIRVTMSMSGSFLGEAEDSYQVEEFKIYFNNEMFWISNDTENKEVTIDRELNTISLKFQERHQIDQDEWLDISYTFNNFTITFTITCLYYTNTYTYCPLKEIWVFTSESSHTSYPISPQLQTLPEFGLVKSNTVYNYIDFDNKKYYQNCTLNNNRTEIVQIDTVEIDISDILYDTDGIVDLTDASSIGLMVGPLDGYSPWSDLCIYEFNYKSKIE